MALLDLTSLTDATEEISSPRASPVSESTNRVSASTAFDDVEEVQGREEVIGNLLQVFENIDEDVSTGDNEPASQDSFGDIANESKSETARLTTKLKGFVKYKSIRKKKGCSIEEQLGPSSSHGALNRIPTSTGHSGDDLYDADMSADLDAYMHSTSMYPLK